MQDESTEKKQKGQFTIKEWIYLGLGWMLLMALLVSIANGISNA